MFPNQVSLIHFLGATVLASGVIAFFYAILAQHRYRQPIQGYFQRMAIGILFGVYGSVAIWIFDAVHHFDAVVIPDYLLQTWGAPLVIFTGIVLFAFAIRSLSKTDLASEYRIAITYLKAGIVFSLAAMVLVPAMIFFTSPLLLIARGLLATFAFLALAAGAYRFRRIDVGGSIQLFVLMAYFIIISIVSYMGIQTNIRVEQRIVDTNLPFIETLVQNEVNEHLTSAAFDVENADGKAELALFLDAMNTDAVRRIRVVYRDGFIATSNLEKEVTTHPALTDEQRAVLEGEGTTLRLVTDNEDLPVADRGLGDLYLARLPIDLQDGAGIRGFVEIAYAAEATAERVLGVQSDIFTILTVTGVLFFLAIVLLFVMLHRQLLHPLADIYEQLTRIQQAESEEDSDLGRRRIHMHANKTFERIAGEYNHFIEEHEKQVGKLKKQLREKGWKE